ANALEMLPNQHKALRRSSLVMLLSASIVCATPAASSAQTKKPQHKAAPAPSSKPARIDCGGSVELRVSAASPAQGTLLIAEVRSPDTLSGVAGKWIDRDISFWQVTGAS